MKEERYRPVTAVGKRIRPDCVFVDYLQVDRGADDCHVRHFCNQQVLKLRTIQVSKIECFELQSIENPNLLITQ